LAGSNWRSRLHEDDELFNADEAREFVSRRLRPIHEGAIVEAIEHAFPELRNSKIAIFVEENDIVPGVDNADIIKRVMSPTRLNSDTGIEHIRLFNLVENLISTLESKTGLNRLIFDLVTVRKLNEGEEIEISGSEKTLTEIASKLMIGASPVSFSIGGRGEKEGETQTTMRISLSRLQDAFIRDLATLVRDLVQQSRSKFFMLEYDLSRDGMFMLKAIADKIKEEPNLFIFVDNGIYLDRDVAELLSKPYSAVIATDSMIRYRMMAYRYLEALREACLLDLENNEGPGFVLSSVIKIGTFDLGRIAKPKHTKLDDLHELGLMLKFMSENHYDVELVHEVITRIDSAPGVLFRVLEYIISDLYVNFKHEVNMFTGDPSLVAVLYRPTAEIRKIFEKNLKRSIKAVAKAFIANTRAFTREANGEVYKSYLNVIEEMTGVKKETVAKVIYVLSVYARAQRDTGKTILFSESSILNYVQKIATPEEAKELEANMPKVINALKMVGFVNATPYGETHVLAVLRPLLLEFYAMFVEMDNPKLKQLKGIMLADLESSTRELDHRHRLSMIKKVIGEKKLVKKDSVPLVDRKLDEELKKAEEHRHLRGTNNKSNIGTKDKNNEENL